MGETFVINDRRGQKKEVEPRPELVLKVDAASESLDKSSWKNVGYYVVMAQTEMGATMIGRAAGLRSDGRAFSGDFMLAPLWAEDFMWQPSAKKRLDTFLGCDCTDVAPCATHKHYFQQWMAADGERMRATCSAPVPEAIEVLLRAEHARQQTQIVTPGARR